jgi:hypothetical protein
MNEIIGHLFYVVTALRVEDGCKVEFLEKGETFVVLELGELEQGIKILTRNSVKTLAYGDFYLQFDLI